MAEGESLIDKNYLKEHFVEVYLQDAIAQLLLFRQDSNKPQTPHPPIKPCKFFKEYFASVRQGNHVLFREFAFISATPYNRLCLLTSLLEVYRNHLFKENKHNAKDYHSMMQLVFPDFPIKIVQDAFNVYASDKKDEVNGIKFLDFVKALKASFCTGDFDYEANNINIVLDIKLEEITEAFSQGGDAIKKLMESEKLVNFGNAGSSKATPMAYTNKILDGSEFKRLLNFNDTCSVSSDEPEESEPISGSSESKKSVSRGKKKSISKKSMSQKSITRNKSPIPGKSSIHTSQSQSKHKGKLGGKHLSNSLNILQSGRTDIDDKRPKPRSRSRSFSSDQQSQ